MGTLYSHWKADIATATDYYPFGMMMPGRYKMMNGDTAVYRFGYGTQEKVNEVAGLGNWYTAKFWEYNPRTGVRANPDPITYPWQSTYATFNNNPILYNDPLGLFGTRKEARTYKKEHDIRGKITKDNDGLYSINDKKNGVSYVRDNSLAGEPNVLGMQEDGVLKSPMVTAEGKGSNSNCYTCCVDSGSC